LAQDLNREGDKQELHERLRSLKIERAPERQTRNAPPRRLLLVLSALVVVAAGAYYYFSSSPKQVKVAEVKISGGPSAGRTTLTVSGYVVAHHKIDVGSKVAGRVKWIGVEKGDKVRQDQVLVRLEDDEYKARVGEARANLAALQAKLDQLRAGSRLQEKLRDRAAVAHAEANLKNAEADYQRTERLFRAGVVSKADFDRATAQRDTAAALLDSARQSSVLTDIGPRTEEIRTAEAQVRQAKASLDYALTQFESTQIRAPISGTILQRIVELGEMVTPSAFGDAGARTSVVSLADLDDLQIELDISQADFARLAMGQRAEIIPESFPDLRYPGFIAEIAPEANRAKATVQVKVKVENPDGQLRPEMNARVNFLADAQSGQAQPASFAMVPKAAVVNRDSATFVFVLRSDRVEMRSIRLGDEAGEFYYVLDGLSGGEMVVIEGASNLNDRDRVTVATQG
jgi:HlyD family secretion protein